jgi:hypothetical protein
MRFPRSFCDGNDEEAGREVHVLFVDKKGNLLV